VIQVIIFCSILLILIVVILGLFIGIPKDYCFNSLNSFFKKFGLLLVLSSFMVSGVLAVVFGTLLCLCCHPSRNKERDSKFHANLLE
jgi:ABC-type spermidine/putrescine transport system permease subunit I